MLRRTLSIFLWSLFFLILIGAIGAFVSLQHLYTEPITVTLEERELTGPRDPIIINFSQPVRSDTLKDSVTIEPAVSLSEEWHDFGKKLILTPRDNWSVDTGYRITVGTGRTTWYRKTPLSSFAIAGPTQPKIVSITPTDGATDIILDVEDPIRVEFDRSVRDFFVHFSFEPDIPVVYRNNPEKTVFEILPSVTAKPGTTYTLSISLKWRNADDTTAVPLGKTRFTTLPPQPASWSQNLALRTEEAKRYTRAKRSEGKYIDINLASQVMTIFENGKALDAYVVSSGKRGMDTPQGEFAIANKALRPWSKRYSLYMPYWMAITGDGLYGIHELPEWPGGYKEGANHLGTPVSHGCVRLGIGSAKRVFEWAEVGTPVIVY